jgi:glycosyltransferase involved in cell wall biosynthesis
MTDKPKKICFFGADFPPTGGGIAAFSYEWVRSVADDTRFGHVTAIMFGNRSPRREKIGVKLDVTAFRVRGFFSTGLLTPAYMLRHFRSDIFHSLNLFPVGFWTVFWSKIFFKKSIVTFYGTDACQSSASPLTKALKRWTIEHADAALTISDFTKNETARRLGIRRSICVAGALLPDYILKAQAAQANAIGDSVGAVLDSRIQAGDFIVLSVCRMVKRKGLDLLIRAISQISDDKVKAVLVGDGKERKGLEDLARELNIADRIIFIGKAPSVEPYYRRADVAVLLSYYLEEEGDFEGLGLTLLEAERYGVPVIGSKSGGIPEAFEAGRTGLLIPENDIEAIKDAIVSLAKDPEKRRAMGEAGRDFVRKKFGKEIILDGYVKITDSLMIHN